MAVKIIKNGTPRQKRRSATCMHCRCVFEFDVDDAELVSDLRDGDYYQLPCPQEGCEFNVTVAA